MQKTYMVLIAVTLCDCATPDTPGHPWDGPATGTNTTTAVEDGGFIGRPPSDTPWCEQPQYYEQCYGDGEGEGAPELPKLDVNSIPPPPPCETGGPIGATGDLCSTGSSSTSEESTGDVQSTYNSSGLDGTSTI